MGLPVVFSHCVYLWTSSSGQLCMYVYMYLWDKDKASKQNKQKPNKKNPLF